jgi:hypothetical protein
LQAQLLGSIRRSYFANTFSLGDGTAEYLATVLDSHEGARNKLITRAEDKHNIPEHGEVDVKFILI